MHNSIQHVTFAGMPAIRLSGKSGDHATVLLSGAQLASWVSPDGFETLCVNPPSLDDAVAPSNHAMQGHGADDGVPILFPQFRPTGQTVSERLAHANVWALHDSWYYLGVPNVTLRLKSNENTRQLWPYAFDCYVHISLDTPYLAMTVEVLNTGTAAMRFHAALCPFFRVSNSTSAKLLGLPGAQSGLSMATPLDCVRFDSSSPLQLQSSLGQMEIAFSGFSDTVVWNCIPPDYAPHPLSASQPEERKDYSEFVCIESSSVSRPIELASGDQWAASHTMRWSPSPAP